MSRTTITLIAFACLFAGVGLLTAGAAAVTHFIARPAIAQLQQKLQKDWQKHRPLILEDLESLAKNPPKLIPTRERNGADYFVRYYSDDATETPAALRNLNALDLEVRDPEKRRFRYLALPAADLREAAQELQRLAEFDHLNLWQSRIALDLQPALLQTGYLDRLTRLSRLPILNLRKLSAVLEMALLSETPGAAEQAHRVQMILLGANDTLLPFLAFKLNDNLNEWFGISGAPGKTLTGEDARARIQRLIWAWPAVLDAYNLGVLEPEVLQRDSPASFICAGVPEAILQSLQAVNLLVPRLWPEPADIKDPDAARAQMVALMDRCGLKGWEFLLDSGPKTGTSWQLQLPFLRRMGAAQLLALSSVDRYARYDDDTSTEMTDDPEADETEPSR